MKIHLTLLALLTATVALAQTIYPVTIKHDAGETTLASRPTRVISLGDIHYEELLALGVQPVGYAHRFSQPPTLGTKFSSLGDLDKYTQGKLPVYVGDLFTPSLEAMLSLKPDLIVSSQEGLHSSLSKIAPTLTLQSRLADSWRSSLPALGKAFGLEKRASEVVKSIESRLRLSREALRRITKKTPRLTLIMLSGQTAFFASNGYVIGKIFEDLGFSITNPSGTKFNAVGLAPLSLEKIPSLETDKIWVISNTDLLPDSALRMTLEKSQRGKVILFNNNLRPLLGPLSLPRFLGEIQSRSLNSSGF